MQVNPKKIAGFQSAGQVSLGNGGMHTEPNCKGRGEQGEGEDMISGFLMQSKDDTQTFRSGAKKQRGNGSYDLNSLN